MKIEKKYKKVLKELAADRFSGQWDDRLRKTAGEKEYDNFSKKLCEQNARAEGVTNISFQNGDATINRNCCSRRSGH